MTSLENYCRGERRPGAKLTAETVRQIMDSTESCAVLADKLHVSRVAIHKVRVGKSWNHITGLPRVKPYERIRELRAEGLV
jgi:hypothetical protein